MPLTEKEWNLRERNVARIEHQATSIGVPYAQQAALEKSKPTRSIPQQLSLSLSETSQAVFKSLSNLANPYSASTAWRGHKHGVPTGFFRLPLEIREQIYNLVTGHKTVLKIPENYRKPRAARERSNNGATALLQTCRQIYAEAITSIYTQNTFHFQDHDDFLAFAHAVNPVSLNQISSLSFDLNSIIRVDGTPYDHQCPRFTVWWVDDSTQSQWSHFWNIIAAMDNLTELKVFIQDPGTPEWDGMQCLCIIAKDILAPLWKIKRELRVFGVDVPWVDVSSWESMKSFAPITNGARFHLECRGIPSMRYR